MLIDNDTVNALATAGNTAKIRIVVEGGKVVRHSVLVERLCRRAWRDAGSCAQEDGQADRRAGRSGARRGTCTGCALTDSVRDRIRTRFGKPGLAKASPGFFFSG